MAEFFNIAIGIGIIFLIGRAYFRLKQGEKRVQREWETAEATTVDYELEDNPQHKFSWHPVHGPKELNTRIAGVREDGTIEYYARRHEETRENGGWL